MTMQNGTEGAPAAPVVPQLDLSGIPGAEETQRLLGEQGQTQVPPEQAPDYSQFTQQQGDQQQPIVDPQAGQQGQQQPVSTDRWEQLRGIVPEPLHQDLAPILSEYDRQFSRIEEESAPYRAFAQQGFLPQDIQIALAIQQRLLEDPRSVFMSLGNTYGWIDDGSEDDPLAALRAPLPGQQPQQGQFDDLFQPGPNGEPPATVDPRVMQTFEAMQQRLDQQQAFIQQQFSGMAQAQGQAQGRAQLEGELNALEAKYGPFDRGEVVRRAFANASSNQDPTLTHAFHQLKDFEAGVLQRAAARRPKPPVVAGGAGNGVTTPQAPKPVTDEDRAAAALALAISLGASKPGDPDYQYQR